jgi:hypothetical protein
MIGPVFVGGTGRCGTTVIMRLFGNHPDIHAFKWETHFIVNRYGLLELIASGVDEGVFRAFEKAMRGKWYRYIARKGTPKQYEAGLCADFREDEIDTFLQLLSERLRPSCTRAEMYGVCREAVCGLFANAVERSGKRTWLEKTPRDVLFADVLLEIFPDARFIHVYRDGRDVVSSILENDFWPIGSKETLPHMLARFPKLRDYVDKVTLELAAGFWADLIEIARDVAADAPLDRYRDVRFEDLVARPKDVVAELCAFLGIEFTDFPVDVDSSRAHVGRYKRDLDASQLEVVYSRAGHVLRGLGYTS